MTKKTMVGMNEMQLRLGVAWPPAHRFINKYGYSKDIVQDPDLGPAVTDQVADKVIQAFRNETTVGRHTHVHNYPRLERAHPWVTK